MKKLRILCLVVAMLMVIGLLAGCGGGGGGNGDADADVITIGVLAPLTGGVAQFGTSVYRGLNLYIDQFNARGGLQIETITFDEEGNASLAVTGYNSLFDQNVTAIIGAVTSGPTMAVVPFAFEDNMPMITASATHAGVTVADDGTVFTNMFRSCFIDPFQGQKMAEFAVEVLEARTAAILFSNEIDYSIGLRDAFEEKARELGLEVVVVENFPDDAVDFRGQLTNIAQHNPDVLFVPAYVRHIALIGPQSAEVGLEGTTLLGADGWAGTVAFMEDVSSIEGAYFLTGFSPDVDDPMVQQFIRDYQARHGSIPDMFAAQAFDAAMILIDAIERTLAATDYNPASEEFRIALIANMARTNLTGVTGHIAFDEFNNPQKTAVILNVADGVEVFWGYF
ncbi:MAG: ABC transporter substrate-binding protein [Oscillospiraceae bacterium]|nr:ABC transporter substrate-binding protein [Oscillospiraceae bacterium]